MNKTTDCAAVSLSIANQLAWGSTTIAQKLLEQESASLDSKLLLCHCLGCNLTYLHTWPEKLITLEQQANFQTLVHLRCGGNPIAYLLGYRDFWSLRLKVADSTLIPRPETELLVETVLELDLPAHAALLDLGTGTGAIALALAYEKPQWQIMGIDKSAAAVELAQQNAQCNQLLEVKFKQSNWFEEVDKQQFNVVVSNPPYVESQSPYLTQGDVRFEPLSALVSGLDGLDDIRFIITHAKDYLAPDGWLLLEHGFEQGDKIKSLLESSGYLDAKTILDLNGLPRVTVAKK